MGVLGRGYEKEGQFHLPFLLITSTRRFQIRPWLQSMPRAYFLGSKQNPSSFPLLPSLQSLTLSIAVDIFSLSLCKCLYSLFLWVFSEARCEENIWTSFSNRPISVEDCIRAAESREEWCWLVNQGDSSTKGHKERRQTGVQGSVAIKGRSKVGAHWRRVCRGGAFWVVFVGDGHQSMRCEKPGHLMDQGGILRQSMGDPQEVCLRDLEVTFLIPQKRGFLMIEVS